MKELFSIFYRKLDLLSVDFERYKQNEISWNNRLIAITGARGTGKTTMLLQYIRKTFGSRPENVLYTSLDNIYFTTNRLYDLANDFHLHGGETLFLDEVHKYPSWAQEIKNIYDDFPAMKVVFTGSSMLKIFNADADLSRRVRHYQLFGMSFREFLIFEKLLPKDFDAIPLEEILSNHIAVSQMVTKQVKPLPAFRKYLQYGYYPYYKRY